MRHSIKTKMYQPTVQIEERQRIILRKMCSLCRFVLYLDGCIAQLVELLFYTQVVIGSSPVAPIKLAYVRGSSSIG